MDDFERAQDLYNKHSSEYIKNINEDSKLVGLRKLVYGLLGPVSENEILFIGCGDGLECVPLAKNGAIVTGIDSSTVLVSRANNLYAKYGIKFMVMDYENTSFQDNSFDSVISIMSIAYKEDLTNVLIEQKRILKNQGTLVIVVHHPIRKMIKYANFNYFKSGLQYETCRGVVRFNYYRTIEEYFDAMKRSGLGVCRIIEPKSRTITPCPKVNGISEDLYPHALIFVLRKINRGCDLKPSVNL